MSYMMVERQGNAYVPITQPGTITVQELATLLGWGVRSTYTHLRKGSIPAKRVGSRWVISRKKIQAWLEGDL